MGRQLHDNRITALYCRLSRDDGNADDSCSIDSQKSMLKEYALNEGFERCEFFVDDGFTGTNFNRPDFARMIEKVEQDKIGTLVVKDLSRHGREYLQTGYYTEIFFPMHDVRFIAINDGVDSTNGENEFAPFRNLLNEMYARDILRKIRSSARIRAKRGEYVNGNPPYGYMRDPDNRNHLVPDKNTAPTVRMIYDLAMEGKSAYAIAIILKEMEIPRPSAYVLESDRSYSIRENCEYPYEWNSRTVGDILTNVTYIGHLFFGMTAHRSFKDKTMIDVPEDQWIKCMDNHEPLVSEDVFKKVQELSKISHKVIRFAPEENIYKNISYCADCGFRMYFSSRPDRSIVGYYSCGRSRLKHNKRGCSAHYITLEEMNKLVLSVIRQIGAKVRSDKQGFIYELIKNADNEIARANAKTKKELDKARIRLEEIDILTQKLFEDHVFGKIIDDIFERLSAVYEEERTMITENIPKLEDSLLTRRVSDEDICHFADLVEQYASINKMTFEISHDLIDHILVYNKDDKRIKNGKRIELFFRFVGKIDVRRRS